MARTHVDAHMEREISIACHFQLRFCFMYDHMRPPWRRRVLPRLRPISIVALGELVYYLLSLLSTIDSFLVVNEIRGLQIARW